MLVSKTQSIFKLNLPHTLEVTLKTTEYLMTISWSFSLQIIEPVVTLAK